MVSRQDSNIGGTSPYEANAVDQLLVIKRALAEGLELFGIVEDDIAPTATPANVNRRIHEALSELPQDADMLFLEYCSEDCSSVRYSPAKPHLLLAAGPACAAAILFTRKGAERVLRACTPVWDVIDMMYRLLIANGTLTAYLAHPAAFLQDRIWGSDASAERHEHIVMPHHLPYINPLCSGIGHLMERIECSTVGRPLPPAHSDGARAVALRPADVHGCAWPAGCAAAGAVVVLYTGSHGGSGRFDNEIGHWPADAPPDELVLQIRGGSVCHGEEHVCYAQIVLEGPDGAELVAQDLLLFLHPAPS